MKKKIESLENTIKNYQYFGINSYSYLDRNKDSVNNSKNDSKISLNYKFQSNDESYFLNSKKLFSNSVSPHQKKKNIDNSREEFKNNMEN